MRLRRRSEKQLLIIQFDKRCALFGLIVLNHVRIAQGAIENRPTMTVPPRVIRKFTKML
jgi:hypothetical protein